MSIKTSRKAQPVKPLIKAFNIRLNKDLWYFLKQLSLDQEVSVNQIVNKCLQKYKDKVDRV